MSNAASRLGTASRVPDGAVWPLGRAEEVTGFGDARLWSETIRIDLRAVEVANPCAGDRIEIDGDEFLIQVEPVRDQ